MIQLMLFLGISFIMMNLILLVSHIKAIPFRTVVSLFAFGMALSLPFLMVEHIAGHLKYYLVILAFIIIELSVLYCEKKVEFFHDLIHHNIKHLRIFSFILIGIGFTYSEVTAMIFSHAIGSNEILAAIPVKATFGIFIHSLLTFAGTLIHAGTLFAESILETVLRFLNYYIRIAMISMSHYLYTFLLENHVLLYLIPFMLLTIVAFFWFKHYLDRNIQKIARTI